MLDPRAHNRHPSHADELSYTHTVNSTDVSKDTAASFNAARSVRNFFPIVVQLWMTAVLFVFIAVRVLASGSVQNLLHRWAAR
jgi:hypothetical protein